MEDRLYILAAIIILAISIILLVKFFFLCSDVRCIRRILEKKNDDASKEESVQITRGEGDLSPTKSDVREFHDRIKLYLKDHKKMDNDWLENLVKEYNSRFNEDFHQYL